MSTYLVPFNFCDCHFFVATCRRDSETLQLSLVALAPGPQGKLGMGKVSCWETGMGMDAERVWYVRGMSDYFNKRIWTNEWNSDGVNTETKHSNTEFLKIWIVAFRTTGMAYPWWTEIENAMPRMPAAKWPLGHGYDSEITLRQGRNTAGDTGDASPVRPTMSPLHQNDNRQFIFGTDFWRVTWRCITAYN